MITKYRMRCGRKTDQGRRDCSSTILIIMVMIAMAGMMAAIESNYIIMIRDAHAQADNDDNEGDDREQEEEEEKERRIIRQASIISVTTDRTQYNDGDVIIVSGEITTRLPDTPVILQIFKDNNPIHINQITPAADNTYWDIVKAEGLKWEREGQYKVSIRYGTDGKASADFMFTPTPKASDEQNTDEGHFEVDAGNETFDVLYAISGGAITDMRLDWRDFTLVVDIDTQQQAGRAMDGYITLDMPRKYIGSEKSGDGRVSDEVFIILVDGVQSSYEEVPSDPGSRKITIPILSGDSEIRVIGTYAVPEFEHMVLVFALVAAGMIAIIALSRTRRVRLVSDYHNNQTQYA